MSVGEHAQDLSHLTGVLVGNAFGLAEEARGGKQVLETEDQTRKLVTKIGKGICLAL